MVRIIKDWERSGNGDGQRAENEEDFGHIYAVQRWRNVNSNEEGEYMNGDNRKSFLRDSKPHILYMWALFDDNDLLKQMLAILD